MTLLRVTAGLIALMALAAFAAWIADQPGSARIAWLGYEITAPAPLLALLAALFAVALFAFAWIIAWAVALPQRRRLKRETRGYAAFAAGMVAVAAGEPERAAKLAAKAVKLLDDPALARLLAAHTAQLKGDQEAARRAFTQLSTDPGTAFLGVRGLLADARARGDQETALALAERASALRPASPFAAEAELDLLLAKGAWEAARARLAAARKRKAFTPEQADRLGAQLDLAEAMEAASRGENLAARKLADRAAKKLPEHPGLAAVLARAAENPADAKAAETVIRRLWAAQPSAALATLWRRLDAHRPAAQAEARLRDLAQSQAAAPASRLLLAQAALDQHDYTTARSLLDDAPLLGAWGASLMARLAEEGDGDAVAADRWRARARAGGEEWQCQACGAGHAAWAAHCGACGGFDTIRPTPVEVTAPTSQPRLQSYPLGSRS